MKYRLLAAFPLVAALVYLVIDAMVPDRVELYAVMVIGLKTLAAIGSASAALRFQRSDYLRLAWLLTAACFVLLLAKDLLWGTGSRSEHHFTPTVALVRGGVTLAANAAGVVGAWLLARAWQVAGIVLPGSRAQRRLITLAGVAVALAIAGHATFGDVRGLVAGDPQMLVTVASDLGDIISTCLIAPVLLTAIALRGGLLAWPWTLMAASQIGWLLYDAAGTVGALSGADHMRLRSLEELFRLLALLFAFASGVAQRLVMTDMRAAGKARHPTN